MKYFTDKRLDGFPLMNSPLTIVIICMVYFLVAKIWGPKLMEKRQAFELRGVLVAYNSYQIIFNGFLFYQTCRLTWFSGYSLFCQPVNYSDTGEPFQILMIGYFFYVSKFVDFLDTLFFILRKKNDQITFLHLYHHAITPISVGPCVRFVGGGHSSFHVTCNTFVHFVMYIYYLMSSMGPNFRKFLWWKKYLTTLQMVQFICVGLHSFQLMFIDCGFPKAYAWWTATQMFVFFLLFTDFYSGAYKRNKKGAPAGSTPIDLKKML